MSQVRRIALLMSQDAGFHRQVLQGIRAFAIDKKQWHFHNAPLQPSTLRPLREWKPHGIVAHLADKKMAQSVLQLKVPVVDTACAIANLNAPTVDVDHRAVGRLAANYFLKCGFRNFGFFGGGSIYNAMLREAGFRETLADAGFAVSSCHVDYAPRLMAGVSWKSVNRRVRQWLKKLITPVAVMACHDASAHDITDMCQLLGLRVPEDVAVLGVDNDELECQLAFPPLSSVEIPGKRIGYECARLLDRMLRGESVPNEPIFLPPLRVVTRQSTSELAIDDPIVASALRYIRNHISEPLRVGTIADALVVRRRDLEMKFRDVLGRTILSEIHRVRVEMAQEMLLGTDLSMAQIAKRLGFSNAQRLAHVFRKNTGMTLSEYRRQAHLGS